MLGENIVTANSDEDLLNPQISKVMIGVRKLRKIDLFPLSICDQMKMSEIFEQMIAAAASMSVAESGNIKLWVAFFIDSFKKHAATIIQYATGVEDGNELLKDITNNQLIEMITVIWNVNFEEVRKNVQKWTDKIVKKTGGSPSSLQKQQPQSLEAIPNSDSQTFSETVTETGDLLSVN